MKHCYGGDGGCLTPGVGVSHYAQPEGERVFPVRKRWKRDFLCAVFFFPTSVPYFFRLQENSREIYFLSAFSLLPQFWFAWNFPRPVLSARGFPMAKFVGLG